MEVSFDSLPKRIISLAPNITEVIFAIGADSLLAGVTDLCDFPPEAKHKVKTGSYFSPDYETISSLNPDLIIMNVENVSNPTYQALKNLGLKIFVSNAKNISGIKKMFSEFGKITGKENEADSLLMRFENDINQINSTGDKISSEPVLVLISVNPLMTTNGSTFINEILDLAGITNLYKDQILDYPNINYEDVIVRNPDFILFPTDTSDTERTQKFSDEIKRQLKKTNAVKNERIILIDENIMFRPGPRVPDAAKILRDNFIKIRNKKYE
ncbi:MAG TPA: helical backbone metal receptor [Ignavibacteria bacterium]|nr:helical backbone metal receptor [Ignavibacteria bacterium]